MKIKKVLVSGFRNFQNAEINFADKTLIIGSNDVGKTNLILGLRKLLDRGLSDLDLEPIESDFYIDPHGNISDTFSITVEFSNISEDSVLAIFPGKIGEAGNMLLQFYADRKSLTHKILAGRNLGSLEEIPSRFYLKHLCMKVVDSRRDLVKFIQLEKKHLLKIAQEFRSEPEKVADTETLETLSSKLSEVNMLVGKLNYVTQATNEVNAELKALAHNNANYSVSLNSTAVDVSQFVERLELLGSANGSHVSLGGDGRNNQILLALWKAKAAREFDHENEVVLYCVEEPEAHLHPHQQRKLASYLTANLTGQTIVTTHSPQIASGYKPDSIIRLKRSAAGTVAASKGCSDCISKAWDHMGYRISILPAEAFFASAVMLVEGPSELLFYRELAAQLPVDLDYFNISILSVDGVAFEVYRDILRAMEIPFVVRTDNDISDISMGGPANPKTMRNLAGLNRCLSLIGRQPLNHREIPYTQSECVGDGTRDAVAAIIEPHGIFVSFRDLEHDLADLLNGQFQQFKGSVERTIKYLQGSKAIRMREFLTAYRKNLVDLKDSDVAKPLLFCVGQAMAEAHV